MEEEVEGVVVDEVVQESHLKNSLTAYQRVLYPLPLLIPTNQLTNVRSIL